MIARSADLFSVCDFYTYILFFCLFSFVSVCISSFARALSGVAFTCSLYTHIHRHTHLCLKRKKNEKCATNPIHIYKDNLNEENKVYTAQRCVYVVFLMCHDGDDVLLLPFFPFLVYRCIRIFTSFC